MWKVSEAEKQTDKGAFESCIRQKPIGIKLDFDIAITDIEA